MVISAASKARRGFCSRRRSDAFAAESELRLLPFNLFVCFPSRLAKLIGRRYSNPVQLNRDARLFCTFKSLRLLPPPSLAARIFRFRFVAQLGTEGKMRSEGPSLLYSLPPELLTKIAILTSPSFASPTHGDKRPLARLRLTSRLLYEIASPLFWYTVRIPGNASRGSLGHNEAFARLFKMRGRGEVPKPRMLVKEMLFVVNDAL